METKMRATEFLNSRDIQMHKLIKNAPSILKSHQVEAAAVEVYKEIEAGLVISDGDLPRYIWKRAHDLSGEKYKREWALATNAAKKVRFYQILSWILFGLGFAAYLKFLKVF